MSNITKLKCKWVNQKGKPCPWSSLKDKKYCKRHSIYENIYEPEDIPLLQKCPTCKNLYKNTNEKKCCDKCINRGNKYKVTKSKKITKKCIREKNNKRCRYNAIKENDYCSRHQNYFKLLKLQEAGHRVCNSHIKGCFAILEEDDISRCKKCKVESNKKEKILRDKKKENATDFNKKTHEKKMCVVCNKIVFVKQTINNKCLKCYDSYIKTQFNRKPKDLYTRELLEYKKSAKKRQIEWLLSDDEAISFMKGVCNYCGYNSTTVGIDRIDSNKHYYVDNCVSCCSICNIMKNTYTVEVFTKIITYLAFTMKLFDYSKLYNNYDYENSKYFECCKSQHNYNTYKMQNYINRNIQFELDEKYYYSLLRMPCHYCNNRYDNGCQGIDRLYSNQNYTIKNCVPCCKTCNRLKNTLSVKQFEDKIKYIYCYFILKENVVYNDSYNKLLRALTNETNTKFTKFSQLRLVKEPDYYNNLIFNHKTCDISKIKIELEFIDKKTNIIKRNIWDYYRRYISSFKVSHESKLIGRQIYILVKDKTTNTYLGILSLSSDYNNLSSRDKYIGWDMEQKYKHLINTINISTCVSTQPFGFNFNGGKLLTALCFSNEVLSHYYEKYNDHLLGITTTSLYGRSIQYERLPFIKFMGLTKGNSVHKISTSTVKLCRQILRNDFNLDSNKYSKFNTLMTCFNRLNIPREDYLVSNKKGVYFGFTHNDSKEYLCGRLKEEPNPIKDTKTVNEIYSWWLKRWAIQRYEHLVKTKRIKSYEESIKEITTQYL